jgi:plastocyanin
LIRCVPQAVANAATAVNEQVMRRTLSGRLMRPEIIIGIPMPGLHTSKLALAAAALCLLAGCSRTLVLSGNRTLRVALSEYRVNPQNVRVSAGELIIYVVNYGRLTHNLVITHGSQTTDSTTPLPPGQSAELALDLTPGKYLMVSTILSDQTLGAYGTLTVTR